MPNSRAKIWLGSYDNAEQAARAFDAAIYYLRGPHANFNFPDTIPAIPSALSLSRQQIQLAAAKYARGQIPSTAKNFTEEAEILPKSSLISETEALSDIQKTSEELDLEFFETLFEDENWFFNSEKFPSLDASTSESTPLTEMQRPAESIKVAQISCQKFCMGRCRCTPSSLE
ncbi:ethylene-responsive transcription factor ERF016-like [Cryptomeria japonica]|uniref:ethylene-responsive transcription factor ERF016-like n=1 Tax=Cryptomeria japonica TaxID=3369 RepID=UPI0025AC16EF|nr:ethylene-responsive transcription factor ERF016-like [Cryptomeria japonica]